MSYPTGVPSPYITHVHPYPTRFHGGIWRRPEFGLPYVRTPYNVIRPSQMQGLGLDFDVGTGVFRRPTVDGGGVFNEISGLGMTSTAAQFLGAAAIAFGLIVFVARKKKMTPNRRRRRHRRNAARDLVAAANFMRGWGTNDPDRLPAPEKKFLERVYGVTAADYGELRQRLRKNGRRRTRRRKR